MFQIGGLKMVEGRPLGKDYPKAAILILLVLLCVGATYYSHFMLRTEVVFSHFFYVPVALAGLWWGRRGAWAAAFLGAMLIASHFLSALGTPLSADLLRSVTFVAVGLTVGILREQAVRSEESLRETRDYLDNLIRHASDPVVVWDSKFKITLFNRAAERLTGYAADEVIGQEMETLFPEANRDESLRWESAEIPILCQDGEIRLVLWNSANIYAEDDKTLVATIAQGQDITERKRAEEVLQRSEQKFKDLTETTTDWVWEVDAQGVYTYASPKIKDVLGYEVSEVLGKTPFDFMLEKEAKRIHKFFNDKVIDREPFYGLENVNCHKDGHLVVLETSGIPIFDKRGQLKGYRGIDRDITERKRVEEALEQRAAQLAILNDIGEKIAAALELGSVLDRTARLVQEGFSYHHVALFTVDCERGDLVMKARAGDFARLYPSDHRLKSDQGMVGWVGSHGERLLANDVSAEPRYVNLYPDVIPTQSELSIPIRVGEEIVGVLDIQSPQLDAFDENDVMVMETLADQIAVAIDNARLYEALRESEARYRIVSELTSDFAYAVRVGPDGSLMPEWATEAFTRITGFTPDEVQVRGGWECLIYPDDMPVARQHLQVHLSGQPDVTEYRTVTKSGEVRWLRDYGRPVWDEVEERVVRIYGAAQDITERKRMEQYMLRTERLAAMGHVSATLAHEVKNPLQAILSSLELALDFSLEPDEREDCLRICWREIEDLLEITQRVLGLAGTDKEPYLPASIAQLVRQTLALLNKPLQKAAVQVTTDFPTDLPPVLVASDQIYQVLLNLAINSIEAMPDGGSLHFTARVEREMLVLTLINDGPPIRPEHIERIFDPFFTTKPDGAGLGLFISHNIVQQHGGTLDIENSPDEQGVAFTLALPVAQSVEDEELDA